MSNNRLQHQSPRDNLQAQLVFEAAALFFVNDITHEPFTVSEIYEKLQARHPAVKLSRESIYPLLARAAAYGFVRFVPPVEQEIARRIKERFPKAREVFVVNTRGPAFNEAVSAKAADVVAGLLREFKAGGRDVVGLGLGPGRSTLDFARSLSLELQASPELPRLNLVGITAGCVPDESELAPVSFFNLFPLHSVQQRIAIWAETLVPSRDFERLSKQVVGVKEAFAAKDDIQIVVTALGDAEDPHDMFSRFYEAEGRGSKPAMIGNIQYRPFTATGPVQEKMKDLRAVTLFEIHELVAMAKQKDRYVVLLARQCGKCKAHLTHARVLRYLLEQENLRVFTHLVMDLATAEELLSIPANNESAGR